MPGMPCKICSMALCQIAGAVLMPKGKRFSRNNPFGVFKVRISRSDSATSICKYACDKSILEKRWPLARDPNKSSTRGIG